MYIHTTSSKTIYAFYLYYIHEYVIQVKHLVQHTVRIEVTVLTYLRLEQSIVL